MPASILLGLVIASTLFGKSSTPHSFRPNLDVWFDHPAASFVESSPIGNGRLGAMIFGRTSKEHVVLNESTMWSGSPQDSDDPNAFKVLPEIRRLLLAGENRKAQDLLQKNFVCKGPGSGQGNGKDGPYGCYQMFCNLEIDSPDGATSSYWRDLDLDQALVSMGWRQGDVDVHREAFASAPAQVIACHFSADKLGSVNFDARLTRPERATTRVEDGQLILEGQLSSGNPAIPGVRFQGRLAVAHRGGTVTVDAGGIHIAGADQATLFFSGGTNMLDPGFADHAKDHVNRALSEPYESLKRDAVRDYQGFSKRVQLELPQGPGASLPTVKRLEASQTGPDDPSLAALYFNFGRYLLIESSRPESPLPNNLQGLWAEELQTPWNGDFHLDVNVEMNYWPAEPCNLSDCAEPLLRFISKLVPNGRKTAKAYYNAPGWVTHVITNPWLFTSPGEGADWGSTCSGSGWLCEHLWNHYAFSLDRQYLQSVYPVLRAAAAFYLNMLIEEPSHGWLVTAPSNSPENAFVDSHGDTVNTCMGPTFDNEIVRELFGNVIAASEVLGTDSDFRAKLASARSRLAPTRVGSHGQIMEWLQDYQETDVHHRHVSPLYGLYPANHITRDATPELAKAAEITLERRGDMGTGWSLGWKICLWARLWDGDHAWLLLKRLFKPTTVKGFDMENGGGTYPNLFDAHPPFQIDGNFGATAGIAEMLIQRSGNTVRLLPALPQTWREQGEVKGLRVPGGITADITWRHGAIPLPPHRWGQQKGRGRFRDPKIRSVASPSQVAAQRQQNLNLNSSKATQTTTSGSSEQAPLDIKLGKHAQTNCKYRSTQTASSSGTAEQSEQKSRSAGHQARQTRPNQLQIQEHSDCEQQQSCRAVGEKKKLPRCAGERKLTRPSPPGPGPAIKLGQHAQSYLLIQGHSACEQQQSCRAV